MAAAASWHRPDTDNVWESRGKGVFTMEEATEIMLADDSRIRVIGMGSDVYTVRVVYCHKIAHG